MQSLEASDLHQHFPALHNALLTSLPHGSNRAIRLVLALIVALQLVQLIQLALGLVAKLSKIHLLPLFKKLQKLFHIECKTLTILRQRQALLKLHQEGIKAGNTSHGNDDQGQLELLHDIKEVLPILNHHVDRQERAQLPLAQRYGTSAAEVEAVDTLHAQLNDVGLRELLMHLGVGLGTIRVSGVQVQAVERACNLGHGLFFGETHGGVGVAHQPFLLWREIYFGLFAQKSILG